MIRATFVRKPLALSSLSMIEMATGLTGRGERRSADMGTGVDMGMGMGMGASVGNGRLMAMSAATHPAVPGASSA